MLTPYNMLTGVHVAVMGLCRPSSLWRVSKRPICARYHAHPCFVPIKNLPKADLRKTLEIGGFQPGNITFSTKNCFLKIPDLKRWAQLAWSYLGKLPTGWVQNDEDKWDEAIADIVEELKSGDGISQNEKGETVLKMIACVAIAKK